MLAPADRLSLRCEVWAIALPFRDRSDMRKWWRYAYVPAYKIR
ncbi:MULTISPECIES: hypothetical protein [Pseudanabaena]|nr:MULTISPECIES: hypothetical protein [Pseudanabaena]MEA5487017.1 hypothetical protein [Pseudanabaena sp. CCNP1317]WGS71776.1 hypothetical protein OA858_19045 [Pseudanabaena galeata CCNP1313]